MQIFGKYALLSTSFLLSKTPILMKEKSELTADYDVKRCQTLNLIYRIAQEKNILFYKIFRFIMQMACKCR